MNTRLLLLCAALIGYAATGSAQVLWKNAEAGMTPDKVAKVDKLAKTGFSNPDKLKYDGIEMLRASHVVVGKNRFKISYYFLKNRLQQVSLGLEDKLPYPAAKRIYDSLSKSLIAKHGKPKERTDGPAGMLISNRQMWSDGKVRISLLVMGLANNPAALHVNYEKEY